jgi:DNA-binding NarL/FixJ family response regulator
VFNREEPLADFLDCAEHVRKGFVWARKEEADSLLEAFRRVPVPMALTEKDMPSLAARELEVVQCAARGKTNKEIAAELRLSEHTVKNYLFRSFEKLGVSSRVELLFYLAMKGHSLGQPIEETEPPDVTP